MKNLFVIVALLIGSANVDAGNHLHQGDRWVYQITYSSVTERARPDRTDTMEVVIGGINPLGKPVFFSTFSTGTNPFGMHSDTCLFDVFVGIELSGNVPCDEPLPVGKTWFAGPTDVFQGSEQWFTVTGIEQVRFGAATYPAIIISTVGPLRWSEGFRRSTYWYVREVKGMMKIMLEGLDEDGNLAVVETATLMSFQPATDDGPSDGVEAK